MAVTFLYCWLIPPPTAYPSLSGQVFFGFCAAVRACGDFPILPDLHFSDASRQVLSCPTWDVIQSHSFWYAPVSLNFHQAMHNVTLVWILCNSWTCEVVCSRFLHSIVFEFFRISFRESFMVQRNGGWDCQVILQYDIHFPCCKLPATPFLSEKPSFIILLWCPVLQMALLIWSVGGRGKVIYRTLMVTACFSCW